MSINRRDFLTKALALSSAAAVLPSFSTTGEPASAPVLPSLKGRKVLFTYGGWDGHEPKKYNDYMTGWLKEEGADVQSFPNLDPYMDKSLMSSIDLVLQVFTMSQIS